MRFARIRLSLVLGSAVVMAGGCASSRSARVASTEPPLLNGPSGGTTVVEAPRARSVSWSDRHPLFSRPREYYDSTQSNKLGKTAAAATIGVASGIGGEFRQIFVGQDPR